jgi:hypothetical protein
VAAISLAGAALTYLIGINVFLRTRLFRDAIGSDPGSLLVDYTSAYSVWPGSVHARGLSIRGRDSHVEWILRIDRCDFRVAFADLGHRKFHADHVRGEGLSLRIRRRVDHVSAETMAALPSVPGFVDPPLADVGPPPPPLTDATYDLWSVELDDVVAADIREVWIDTVRYSGALEVRGRWVFRPLRWLDVGPATVDARSLDVSYGLIEPWFSGVAGSLEVTVHPLDLVKLDGAEIISQVSIRGDLKGRAWAAQMANRALGRRSVAIAAAEGSFSLRAEIDHGVLRPGTRVDTQPFDARATRAGLALAASVQAEFHVVDDDVAYADLRLADARVSAGTRQLVRVATIAATFTSRDLDLKGAPFDDSTYVVDARGARTRSLEDWRPYVPVPSGVRVTSGAVAASGRLEGTLRSPTGKASVSFGVKDLALVSSGNATLRGQVSGVVHLEGSLESKRVALSRSQISLRDVHAIVRGVTADVPTLDARTDELVFSPRTGLTGRVSLAAPVVQLPSLSALGALLPLPEGVVVERGWASARVRVEVDLASLSGSGEIAVSARDLALRMASRQIEGDMTVAIRARQRGSTTDLSGSQAAFRSTGTAGTPDWWGRVQLRHARFQVRPEPLFRASVSAASSDGSPLTSLVADNTAIPEWLLRVVSTKGLEATGDLLVTPSVFAMRSVEAHAKGADADFELGQVRSERKEWALLLDLGIARAGVDVADGRTQVLLFGARPWFASKVASLQAAERRSE